MGATVTTGKLAAAFRKANGAIVYVLFEATYEKNCYPHTSEWGCICIGPIEEAMERIFLHASNCEGGMLQTRRGYTTPENYIAGWMRELRAPVEMPILPVYLSASDSIYSPIPLERLDDVIGKLHEVGRPDIAYDLKANKSLTLRLDADIEAILKIYSRGSGIAPWRIVRHAPVDRARCADLGYSPAPVKEFTVDQPAALMADENNMLLQDADGKWHCDGWKYSIVGDYVANLWKRELAEPGSYKQRIAVYRAALDAAKPAPEGTVVKVDLTANLADYLVKRLTTMISAEGEGATKTPTGAILTVTWENRRLLASFPASCATWILPEGDTAS